MRPIIYRRRFYTVAETFFSSEPPEVKADVMECIQAPKPVPHARCETFHSIVIDLKRDRRALWEAMHKDTRYEVRRAIERDGFKYRGLARADAATVTRFISFYEEFAREKRLAVPDVRRLEALAQAGSLDLSVVHDPDGRELGWHAYCRGDERVVLLYSASALPWTQESEKRNMIGRANRLHHWEDLVRYRDEGFSTYDLGGWSGSGPRGALRGIDAFKEGFGGAVVQDWNCALPRSLKGKAVLRVRSVRGLHTAHHQS